MSKRNVSRSHLKKELYKLAVARSDIGGALETCQLMLQRVNGLSSKLYVPLFHAAVIAYGRPFVDNKSTGVLPKQWSEFKDARLNQVHKALLKTRHEIVAHSDSFVRSVQIVPAGYEIASHVPPSKHVGLIVNTYYQPKQFFIDAHDASVSLISRLTERIEELLLQLYSEEDVPEKPFPLTCDENI